MQTNEQAREWYHKNKERLNWKWQCSDCWKEIRTRNNKSWKCLWCSHKKETLTFKERYAQNPEYFKEKNKRAYEKNKEKRKEEAREYRRTHEKNRDKANANWRRNSKTEKWRINSAKSCSTRRIRLRWIQETGKYTSQEWIDLCTKYSNRCVCCKEEKPLTVDHIKPISKWWLNTIGNIQPLCKNCNSQKRDKEISYI